MPPLFHPAVAGTLLCLALAAPLAATAAPSIVRDAQGRSCKLVSMRSAGHGFQAKNAYDCGGVLHSPFDPSLSRTGDERVTAVEDAERRCKLEALPRSKAPRDNFARSQTRCEP